MSSELDGIARKKRKRHQWFGLAHHRSDVDLEELSQTPRLKRQKKLIDTFNFKRVRKLKPDYAKKERSLRIKKTSTRSKRNFFAIGSLIIFLCIILAFFNSSLWAAIYLIGSLKNENILIGFQNSAELRPTGGFWGSFGIWEVENSPLKSSLAFETNPYKNNNKLMQEVKVEPPKPMKETWPEDSLGFVNANWSFDFPTAAKTLAWYFGQGWNRQVSGVGAVSSLAMIDLLKLTGPVTASDGTEINTDNFTQIMSQKIETEYWLNPQNLTVNEPKTIIKEIAPQIIEKTKGLSVVTLYKFFIGQAREGRLLCYFPDQRREKLCERLGMSGASKPYEVDYLSINNTNLNGGKTSLNVREKIGYQVTTAEDKTIADLQIERSHSQNSWPNIQNRNYTRIITPLGTELISAEIAGSDKTGAVDKYEEAGKTIFGFWFSVDPGQTKTAKISYRLPTKPSSLSSYKLVLQKQPGTLPDQIKVRLGDKILYDGVLNLSNLNIKL